MSDAVVLIADPDVRARERYEVALSRAGFNVVSAADGTSALRLATRLVPDDLLMEIALPHLDGFHLAQRLRKQPTTARMGIVAVTSYAGDDLRQRAAESGIDAVLRKTRSIHDIVRTVRQTTNRSRELAARSVLLREELNAHITVRHHIRARTREVLAESHLVAQDVARTLNADADGRLQAEMLGEADGARDVMVVDPTRGEALFAMLFERYGDDALLHYKRGEAYRALGRRKAAHQEFAIAAERLPEGVWRDRARFAAMRTRSHHEPVK